MTSRISHTTVDSHNAYAQSVWWANLLGMHEDVDDPNEPGHEECMIFPSTGLGSEGAGSGSQGGAGPILFIEVPDNKQVKNRLHFDLRPTDGTRDEEIQRVLSLGATEVADRRNPDGSGWMVLADPEGNEFCILRSDAELPAS